MAKGVHSCMKIRRRYHFGYPGLIYVLITVLLAIGAVNSQNNLLFLAFGLSLGAGVFSGFLSGAIMMRLHAERSLPTSAAVGQPCIITYKITNRSRFIPAFALIVQEHAPKNSASSWMRYMPRPRGSILHLAPKETAELSVSIEPTRRGEAQLHGISIVSSFPFGLVSKSVTFEQHAGLLIYPRSERLRREATSRLLSRADLGLHSAPKLGRGDEFFGLRNYTPGDSPRHISWRVIARSGNLVVRENTTPTGGTLWVLLNFNEHLPLGDAPPENHPTERAISMAASLVDAALAGGMDVGLAVAQASVIVNPTTLIKQRPAIMATLARLDQHQLAANPSIEEQIRRLTQRAACVVVHSGQIDPTIGPPHARHLSGEDSKELLGRTLDEEGVL